MSSTVLPLNFRAGVARFSSSEESWKLLEPMGDEPRVAHGQVIFDQPFSVPPVVHAGLAGFDVSNSANARLEVCIESVSERGFIVELRTWLDTRIWSANVSWLAIGH